MKKRVVIGMSGGVDSSVAAWLLKEQGYEVIGVTMQIWPERNRFVDEQEGGCCGLSAVDDAKRVAARLEIPHYVMNFRDIFQEKVIDYFISEYQQCRTPNPCIACNRYVKWEALLNRSLEIGADYIATGHYSQIKQLENGRYAVCKSVTDAKDQTYALYNLTQDQLRRTLFPVGAYSKDQIREFAANIGLTVANKPDSQEICFIPDNDYAGFIEENQSEELTKAQKGNFVSTTGEILGPHKGITHYTIGQRKGLGLSLKEPGFVTEINPDTKEVIIGKGSDVWSHHVNFSNVNAMGASEFTDNMRVWAKVRYSHKGQMATIHTDGDSYYCEFDEPVRAATPGQAIVFYDGDVVLGGGTIERNN
ncbi:tRNA (5-methylaminomethyl-2-thiouridylate)-methyltransferase [Lachnospiraceae bacterium TWA4]|nr:tRNA (5-methylaminomethyl-2-thiouridylate)-methyltransferase [Lachnospiraceae bacterium TWA4]